MKKLDVKKIREKLEALRSIINEMRTDYDSFSHDTRASLPKMKIKTFIYFSGNIDTEYREMAISKIFDIIQENIEAVTRLLDAKKNPKEILKLVIEISDQVSTLTKYHKIGKEINNMLNEIKSLYSLAQTKLTDPYRSEIQQKVLSLRGLLLKDLESSGNIESFYTETLPRYRDLMKAIRKFIMESSTKQMQEILTLQDSKQVKKVEPVPEIKHQTTLFDEIMAKISEATIRTLETWLKTEYETAIKTAKKEISLKELNDEQIKIILELVDKHKLNLKYNPTTKVLVIENE